MRGHLALCESQVYGVSCGNPVAFCFCTVADDLDHFDDQGRICSTCAAMEQKLGEWAAEIRTYE